MKIGHPPSRRKATLDDVAKAASVSKAAAANVLNGSCQTARVGPETARRVREKARELGYEPDRLAQRLAGVSARTIGVIAPELLQPSVTNMAAVVIEMNRELVRNGYTSLMGLCAEWDRLPRKFIAEMVAYRLEGLVLAGLNSALDTRPLFDGIPPDMPVVVAGDLAGYDGNQVVFDKTRAMAALADLCIGRGHRHFAYVRSTPGSNTAKLAGLARTLRSAGLPWDDSRVSETTDSLDDARDTAARLAALRPAPTCILCSCDMYAIKLIRGLRQMGLEVPGDVSVAGFDDVPWVTRLSDVPLTTVRQPREQMGCRAARMLLERIARPGGPAEKVVLMPEVVVRESVGPPRARGRKR